MTPPIPARTTVALLLRSDPNEQAPILATIRSGTVVGLDGALEEDGWVPVTLSGWVAKRYLENIT